MSNEKTTFVPAENGDYYVAVEKIVALKKESGGTWEAVTTDGEKYELSTETGLALIRAVPGSRI